MLVPVSKTIWWGKVGTPEKCACIVIVPISGVPVSDIYCTLVSIDFHATYAIVNEYAH